MKSFKINRFQWMIVLFLPLCLAPTCQPKNILRSRKPDNIPRSGKPDLFGIYISTLDGKNMKPIITDSYREMNHARVLPNKEWVTFSRFNNVVRGVAEEKNGYKNSEIMIVRLDATELQSLTGAHKEVASVNSSWTPDGKGLVYISNDFRKKKAQISHIDVTTRKISRVPTPTGLMPSDPHWVGNQIVFPVWGSRPKRIPNSIWIMNADGTQARQLSKPIVPESAWKIKLPPGDSDPKISPDGTKVAFTRNFGVPNLHTIIIDLETGKEIDTFEGVTSDVMPEWSSDGKLLIFWHVNRKDSPHAQLYTMRPDGSERKRVPLPWGYEYKMPAFFPGEGSSSTTRIIFNAKKVSKF